MKKSILTSFALVLFALGASAQVSTPVYNTLTGNYTFTQKVNLNAQAIITDNNGGGGGGTGTGDPIPNVEINEIDFTFNTVAHYDNGIADVEAHNFKVVATAPWQLQVQANSEYFTSGVEANADKVSHDKLSWATTSGGTYTALSQEPAQVTSGSVGGLLAEGHDFKMYYKLNPGYIPVDTYSLVVKYTLTAQ
jgi:hypothetical protein